MNENSSSENLSVIENKFFNSHRTTDLNERAIIEHLKRVNSREHFVERTVERIGFPRWDKIIHRYGRKAGQSSRDGDSTNIYFIPFVRDSANVVNASMILTTASTDTTIKYLCDWQYRDTVSTGLSSRSQFLLLMGLDKNVFGERMYQIKDTTAFGKDENNKTIRYLKFAPNVSVAGNNLMVATTVSVCYWYWHQTDNGQVNGNCNPELEHCINYVQRYRCDNYTVWTFVEENGGSSGGGSTGGGGSNGGGSNPPECDIVPVDPLTSGRNVDPCEPGWEPMPIDDEPTNPPIPAQLMNLDYSGIADPCLLGVIHNIGAGGHSSYILRTYFNQGISASGQTKRYNVKYLTDQTLVGSNGQPKPATTDVFIESDGSYTIQIKLRTNMFQTSTKEWVTSVILHELAHGIISVERPWLTTSTQQHIWMFENYVPISIYQSLAELFPGIDAHNAIALGLGGMSEAYLIPNTNTIDPNKDLFAQEKYFQNLNQAITVASNYQNAVPGFGTDFC